MQEIAFCGDFPCYIFDGTDRTQQIGGNEKFSEKL